MTESKFLLTQEDRNNLPKDVFGDPERRLFPILSEDDVLSASRLLGRAKISDKDRIKIKKRIIKIAAKKNYKLPDAWSSEQTSDMSASLGINSYVTWTNHSGDDVFGIIRNINLDTAIVELCDVESGHLIPSTFTFSCNLNILEKHELNSNS